jgi:hypothetical protein
MAHSFSQDDFTRALEKLAGVMAADPQGHVYIPIFERLERELAALQARDAAMRRAQSFLDRRQHGAA